MRIGLLVSSVNGFGQGGYYNSQEIGLAKALSRYARVIIYKLVSEKDIVTHIEIDGYENIEMINIPSKHFGINGIVDFSKLKIDIDILIHFSDTQFSVPKVYKWCKRNGINYIPYIGVVESHSSKEIIRFVTNLLFKRNLNIYKKCHCAVKNPSVIEELKKRGVEKISLAPVGLDVELLNRDYQNAAKETLKVKYGFAAKDKVIAFVGRFEAEKDPVRMVEIFAQIHNHNPEYKLVMIGKGILEKDVDDSISKSGLIDSIKLIRTIPNNTIWEIYSMADCFVNLNRQEIFGMAILEALYYECKVVAWKAPGPEFILDSGKYGNIVTSNEEAISCIMQGNIDLEEAHNHIMNDLLWDTSAKIILDCIKA